MRSLITEEARNLFGPGLPAGPAMALLGLSRSIPTICFISPLPSEGTERNALVGHLSRHSLAMAKPARCESTGVDLDRRSRKAC